jgi:hypothetical protein
VNSLRIEKLWPWFGAVIVVIVWWCSGKPFPPAPDGLFGAAATVASVFASFLGVSKAIILTIKGTQTYRALEKAHYTETLFQYLKTGIYASVMFASLSIIGFFIDHNTLIHGYKLYDIFCIIWIACGSLAVFTYVRIANILFRLLKQPEVTAG